MTEVALRPEELRVQGFGEQDVDGIWRWLEEEERRIRSKKNRLLQARADVLAEHFYDSFKRRVPNPPQEAQEELDRLDVEIAKCEAEPTPSLEKRSAISSMDGAAILQCGQVKLPNSTTV